MTRKVIEVLSISSTVTVTKKNLPLLVAEFQQMLERRIGQTITLTIKKGRKP